MKHSYDLVNVHDCHNGISGIHGKALPEQLSIRCEHNRSHSNKCSTYLQDWCLNKMIFLWSGNDWLGESFMEIPVFDW